IYFGNGWSPRRVEGKQCPPGFYLLPNKTCIDDNECGGDEYTTEARCGANTECYNSPGSFYCTCKKGYTNQLGTNNFTSRTNCRDIDECETDPCGLHATCTNKFRGFDCGCKDGFVSTTGERIFTNKTKTQCRDIDECESDPCGLNAECTNTFGDFRCRCNDGFVSTTGERTFTDKTSTQCQDIDECYNSDRCGPNATCTNTNGAFNCSCKQGYTTNTGERTLTNRIKTQCQDVDECSDEERPCGHNASCENTLGGFYCTCNRGFIATNGNRTFTNKTQTQCKDIDECMNTLDVCGYNASCYNKPGAFHCTCDGGFVSTNGESHFINKTETQCKELSQNNLNQCSVNNLTAQMSHTMFQTFCSYIYSITNLVDVLPFQEIISNSSDLLMNDSLWKNMEKEQRLLSASIFLQSVENFAIAASLNLPDLGKRAARSKSIDGEVITFRGKNSSALDRASLKAKGNMLHIYRQTVIGGKSTGTDFASAAFIVYQNMDSILNGSIFNHSSDGGNPKPFQLISNVVSAVISNMDGQRLSPAVNITLAHTKKPIGFGEMFCVHWIYVAGKGYWSPNGCNKSEPIRKHTQCRCNHLSTLALLMSPVMLPVDLPVHDDVINIISNIGLCVSLVCLGITIVTFAIFPSLQNVILNVIHLHLCLSLFLAELLFIVGLTKTRNRVMCGIIAGFLHYFFLAAFFWMFLEAVQLCHMIRNIRNLRAPHLEKIQKYMYFWGYGGPAVIVIISAAVNPDGYGSHIFCWLSTDNGLVWSFLGPVCLIIAINTVVFFAILYILKQEIAKRDTRVSKLQDTRMITCKAFAQVFLLGCTWIFGFVKIPGDPGVMNNIFSLVNSFQGTVIFILLCVLNPKVRAEYRKQFAKMCKAKCTKASSQDENTTTSPQDENTTTSPQDENTTCCKDIKAMGPSFSDTISRVAI
ncbi:adhesion G protein-coupled receptor E3-like, partial [Mustelus asterias]